MSNPQIEEFRRHLLQCLGGEWPEPCPLNVRSEGDSINGDGYWIERLSYEVEQGDRVGALLLMPEGVDHENPAPAVAVWHQHNGQYHLGKSEPAGLEGDPTQWIGPALARRGYVVLCPDAAAFEERQDPDKKLGGGQYERFLFLKYVVEGKSLAWKNILDMRRAIDYLCSRDEVRADRIGCFGHSMGSTFTWLVGPWELRLKCLVGNCCLPTYAAIHRTKILHCFPNFIPGLMEDGKDTSDVAALIAPRPLLLNFGENDGGSPIKEVREAAVRIAQAYAGLDAAENFHCAIESDVGHAITDSMRDRTLDWFDRHLR